MYSTLKCATCGEVRVCYSDAHFQICEPCARAEYDELNANGTIDELYEIRDIVRGFPQTPSPTRTLYRITEPTYLADDGTDPRDTGHPSEMLICGDCAPKFPEAEVENLAEVGSGYWRIPTCDHCGRKFTVEPVA